MTRRFYELVDDMSSSDRWHLDEIFTAKRKETNLDSGVRVEPPEELVTKISHAGPAFEFTLTSFGVPVATQKLAGAITKIVGSDVQCLPLTVKRFGSMVVLNVLRVVRCVDERYSEFEKVDEGE